MAAPFSAEDSDPPPFPTTAQVRNLDVKSLSGKGRSYGIES
uniref:Uncharacterized protein n=1 Tax=Tetraselmis sp. GSL018 TaxID=582737 RepID=A0A061RM25_9CHLO